MLNRHDMLPGAVLEVNAYIWSGFAPEKTWPSVMIFADLAEMGMGAGWHAMPTARLIVVAPPRRRQGIQVIEVEIQGHRGFVYWGLCRASCTLISTP